MSKSSRKGSTRENEWASFVGGKKMSRLGYTGPDVISPKLRLARNLSVWEVKSKEDMPKWLVGDPKDPDSEGWLEQMEREGADAVVFRQNRRPWYMIVRIDEGDLLPCGTAVDVDAALAEQVGHLESDLASLQDLKSLEHASQSSHIGGKNVDLVLQLGDTISPELKESIRLCHALLANLRQQVGDG